MAFMDFEIFLGCRTEDVDWFLKRLELQAFEAGREMKMLHIGSSRWRCIFMDQPRSGMRIWHLM